MLRHRLAVDVAARLDLGCDLRRYVFGPVLQRVEGDHPHRIVELARQQVADHGIEVGALEFGLAVDGIQRTNANDDELDRMNRATVHDIWWRADSWHACLPQYSNTRPPAQYSSIIRIISPWGKCGKVGLEILRARMSGIE